MLFDNSLMSLLILAELSFSFFAPFFVFVDVSCVNERVSQAGNHASRSPISDYRVRCDAIRVLFFRWRVVSVLGITLELSFRTVQGFCCLCFAVELSKKTGTRESSGRYAK